MVRAKKPEVSPTVNTEEATPEVAPSFPVQEKSDKPKQPKAGSPLRTEKSANGFTIEHY